MVATIDSLVDQLSVMRGAAMKAGQVLSTVEFPGLDPDQAEYLQQRLASLRDNVPAVSWEQMREVLEREWGEEPEDVLAEIDPEPAAAASIGQVHRARSHEGEEVAVKVQYPGIAEAVESDMRNLRLLTPVLRRLMPGLDVKEVLAELAERVTEECDYELEAANHRRIARFWRGHPFVRSRAVDTALSRRRVLVTEWVDGIGFERVAAEPDPVRDRFAEIVYRFFYGNAAELELALGDPHPGNYLLARRRPGRVLRLRDGPRPAARVPAPRGPGVRRDQDVRRAGSARGDARARLPARALGRVERRGDARAHARRGLVVSRRPAAPARARGRVARERVASRRQRRRGYEQMRHMTLPPEALLLRRMEGMLFQIASTVRAENAGAHCCRS